MSNYKGHLAGGCVTYFIVVTIACWYVHPSGFKLLEWFLCALMGALFPDIDIKSKGQKYFYWLILCIFTFLLMRRNLETLAWASIIALVPMLVPHRSIFHNVWFILAIPCIAWFFLTLWLPLYKTIFLYDTLFFTAGALSHLLLDYGPKKLVAQFFRGSLR